MILKYKKMNKKTKIITCVNCTKFCSNQDLNKLNIFLKKFEKEGYDEVIFCCEIWRKFLESACIFSPIRIGVKNEKGKIKYI